MAEIASRTPTDAESMQEVERMNGTATGERAVPSVRDRFLGCLLGGTVGDALGAMHGVEAVPHE